MRLLEASTKTLVDFPGTDLPAYTILSHRWEDEEVTFQDLINGNGPSMSGWAKIEGCCRQTLHEGWKWCWIDTCCIDKKSSAELSEAINSMFSWYQRAQVCYAYLSDVSDECDVHTFEGPCLRSSAWFTRGWTLQELLAPSYVDFFTKSWRWLGTKSSLEPMLAQVTGIDRLWEWESASVAQKMSWASKRLTTRDEDQAYSLLGLFDVHLSPLYGEGDNAFVRLQLAILNKVDDDSIFAWDEFPHTTVETRVLGLLAPSPRFFATAHNVVTKQMDWDRPPCTMTGKGLGVHFIITPLPGEVKDTSIALLNCERVLGDTTEIIGLCLERRSRKHVWARSKLGLRRFQMTDETRNKLETLHHYKRGIIYVPQEVRVERLKYHGFHLDALDLDQLGLQIRSIYNSGCRLLSSRFSHYPTGQKLARLSLEGDMPDAAAVAFHIEANDGQGFVLVAGTYKQRLWVNVLTEKDARDFDAEQGRNYPSNVRCERISRLFMHGTINARVFDIRSAHADGLSGIRDAQGIPLIKVVKLTFQPGSWLEWPLLTCPDKTATLKHDAARSWEKHDLDTILWLG